MPKVKIPKNVAGVKIPKKVRRRAKRAIRMADGSAVRELVVAAAGLATAVKGARMGARLPRDGDDEGSDTIRMEADRIGGAFKAAAIEGLRRFLEGFEEGLRKGASDAEDSDRRGAPGPARRKPTARADRAAAAPDGGG